MNPLFLIHLVALLLLGLGIMGIIYRQSLIGILISVELLLNGAGVAIMASPMLTSADPVLGQLATLLIMGVAAAEVTLVLAIIFLISKEMGFLSSDQLNQLKG